MTRTFVIAALVLAACGGSHAPAENAPAPTESPTSETTSPVAPSTTSAPSSATSSASSDAPAPVASAAPSTDKRLEDVKLQKTTSAGGHYAVNIVSASGITPEDVVRVIGTSPDDCYAKLFKKQLGANGKTTLDITISAAGKATTKLRGDDLKNPDLVKCLEKVVKGLDFGKPSDPKGGKTTVDFAVAGN